MLPCYLASVIAISNSPILRDDVGTYLLVMQCTDKQTVEVGAQEAVALDTGVYVYVGSAFGPGGVAARVRRHARTDHAQHWHIDYIRPHCSLQGAWVSYVDTKLECTWARALLDTDRTSVPQNGLGSSDCGCCAHFMRWEAEGKVSYRMVCQQIEGVLQEAYPDGPPVWLERSHII